MEKVDRENQTLHTANRALYERLVIKLLKTNAVFTVLATVRHKDTSKSEEILLHPFKRDAVNAFYTFAYNMEQRAAKFNGTASWEVTLHKGSNAAYTTMSMFNEVLRRCPDPTTED